MSQVSAQPYLLVVHPSLPAKTVRELVAYAKANPGKLNYPSSGQGSIIQLATELLCVQTGTRMTHVPYKGMGAAYPDLLAGNMQIALASIVSGQPHMRPAGCAASPSPAPGARIPRPTSRPSRNRA